MFIIYMTVISTHTTTTTTTPAQRERTVLGVWPACWFWIRDSLSQRWLLYDSFVGKCGRDTTRDSDQHQRWLNWATFHLVSKQKAKETSQKSKSTGNSLSRESRRSSPSVNLSQIKIPAWSRGDSPGTMAGFTVWVSDPWGGLLCFAAVASLSVCGMRLHHNRSNRDDSQAGGGGGSTTCQKGHLTFFWDVVRGNDSPHLLWIHLIWFTEDN